MLAIKSMFYEVLSLSNNTKLALKIHYIVQDKMVRMQHTVCINSLLYCFPSLRIMKTAK